MALAGMAGWEGGAPAWLSGCDAAAALRPLLPPRLRGTSSAVDQRGRAPALADHLPHARPAPVRLAYPSGRVAAH